MPQMVFRLNNVPESEVDLVRDLLETNNVDFYETDAGRWGISVAAFWVKEEAEFKKARQLIEDFQVDHRLKLAEAFKADQAAGRIPSFWQLLKANPIMYILYWVLILAVLAISTVPIYHFFN